MIQTRTARLINRGASQTVCLPAGFRFEGREVHISRDSATGDVRLSSRPGACTWSEFFELVRMLDIPDDFMSVRPMNALISK